MELFISYLKLERKSHHCSFFYHHPWEGEGIKKGYTAVYPPLRTEGPPGSLRHCRCTWGREQDQDGVWVSIALKGSRAEVSATARYRG